MFGLSPLIMLIGGVGIVAMLGGGAAWMHGVGKEAQKAEDAPIIEKWQGRATLAETANSNVRHDVDRLQADVQSCTTQVDILSRPTAKADSDIALAKKRSD